MIGLLWSILAILISPSRSNARLDQLTGLRADCSADYVVVIHSGSSRLRAPSPPAGAFGWDPRFCHELYYGLTRPASFRILGHLSCSHCTYAAKAAELLPTGSSPWILAAHVRGACPEPSRFQLRSFAQLNP